MTRYTLALPLWVAFGLGLCAGTTAWAWQPTPPSDPWPPKGIAPSTDDLEDRTLSGFSAYDRERIKQLRAWLQQRAWSRQLGGAPGFGWDRDRSTRALPPIYRAEPNPTNPYILPWQAQQDTRRPSLHIARGPDGRLYHRYVFNDASAAEIETDTPVPSQLAGPAMGEGDESVARGEARASRHRPSGHRHRHHHRSGPYRAKRRR